MHRVASHTWQWRWWRRWWQRRW